MRAHFTIYPKRPAASKHGDQRGTGLARSGRGLEVCGAVRFVATGRDARAFCICSIMMCVSQVPDSLGLTLEQQSHDLTAIWSLNAVSDLGAV
jgi:hypothetical protein